MAALNTALFAHFTHLHHFFAELEEFLRHGPAESKAGLNVGIPTAWTGRV